MKSLSLSLLITGCLILTACQPSPPPPAATETVAVPEPVTDTVHRSPHELVAIQAEMHPTHTEEQWDSINGTTGLYKPADAHKRRSDFKVFGWHISTHGTLYKSYNYDLLWGVSYFSYLLDPATGGYKNIYNWKKSSMIDSAHKHGCKVFLTVSNFGAHDNALFLSNKQAWSNLSSQLIGLLKLRKAEGINLDFESVSAASRAEFTEFINYISHELKTADPHYQLSLALYAVDFEKVFEIKKIDASVDFYTMMGYDYFGSFSKVAGPVSPLKPSKAFGPFCVEHSVSSYLAEGVPPAKFILGLPYYGADYLVPHEQVPANVNKFVSAPPWRMVHGMVLSHKIDPVLDSCYSQYIVMKQPDNTYKQLWYEGYKSLSVKYSWVKQQKLGGVGIWALGYDHGYEDLWALLASEFGQKKKKGS